MKDGFFMAPPAGARKHSSSSSSSSQRPFHDPSKHKQRPARPQHPLKGGVKRRKANEVDAAKEDTAATISSDASSHYDLSDNDSEDDENGDDDDDDDDDDEMAGKGKTNEALPLKKKRKHRPTEMSSKKRPPRLRDDIAKDLQGVRKARSRDPRFDPLSGRLNQDLFSKSYDFVETYQKQEKDMLQKKLAKTKNLDEKQHLSRLLTRMNDQARAKEQKRKAQDVKRTWRKEEKERTQQGKRPYFLKKSKEKEMLLRDKYNAAKEKGPQYLEKMLEKRRQRNTTKEHRLMPMAKEASA